MTRTGSGKALHLVDINTDTMANDALKENLATGSNKTNYMQLNILKEMGLSGANTQRGVAEVWFYDTMRSDAWQLWITAAQTAAAKEAGFSNAVRLTIRGAGNNYTSGDNFGGTYPKFTHTPVTRTKGWHQLLVDYSKEDTYTFYIDGQTIATRTAAGWNGGLYEIRIDRFVNSAGDLPIELYFDDSANYDMTWTNRPSLENAEVTDLDVTKTVTHYSVGKTGTVKAIATVAGGSKLDATGSDKVSYTVSDPSVITIGADGTIQALKVGYAQVTVTVTGANGTAASKKLIITVGSDQYTNLHDANNGALNSPAYTTTATYEYAKDVTRAGEQSYHMVTAHNWMDRCYYERKGGNHSFTFTIWMYDGGIGSAETPSISINSLNPKVTGISNNPQNMSVVMGIKNASQRYYTLTNSASNRSIWGPAQGSGSTTLTGQYTGNYLKGDPANSGTAESATSSFTNPTTGTVTEYPGTTVQGVERTKGWRQFALVCDAGASGMENIATPNGKMEFYIDGELIYTDRYVPLDVNAIYPLGTGYISDFQTTHYPIERKAPEVKEISLGTDGNIISGTAYTAQAVTVDPNGYNQEAQVALTWQTSTDGTSWTDAGSGAAYTPATPGSYVRAKAVATGAIDGKVSADTFSAVKQVGVANPKLTFAINGNGSVKHQETDYQNGGSLTASNGDNVTLTVEPAYGYKIGSVTAGGQELTVSQEGTVILENLNVDTDVVVTFAEREKEKPSAVANSKVQSQNDYKVSEDQDPVFAAVLYSRVNEGYGYTISETGIKLENDQGRFLMLPCVGNWVETKAYGIRVFGAGLVEGTRYTMTPYVKVVDPATGDTEYLYGEPESFTK